MKKQILTIISTCFALFVSGQGLNLDSLKNLTLENNKQIIESRLKVKEAEQVKKIAFTNYFPQVFGGALAMKANDYLIQEEIPGANLPVYDGNPASLMNPTQFAYFPGMELNLFDYMNVGFVAAVEPVYMGGQIRNGNKLASLSVDINGHGLILSQEEALLKTEEYYWTLTSLKGKMNTLESYKKMLDTLYSDVSVFYEVGLAQKSDLLKVELSMNKLEANRIQLENGVDLLTMMICQHVGINYNESIEIQINEIPSLEPKDYFISPDTAVLNRQEYQMLEMAIEAEKLQKRIVRGEQMPQLMVGAQGLYLDVMESESTSGLLFASLNIPISGWWGGAHKIKEHQIKIDIAENKLAESTELLTLQIEKAYKDLAESRSQVAIAEKSVEQVNEHLKVTKDNYDAGLVSTSDMLEAQAMFQEAEDGLTDAKSMFKIRQAHYLNAIAK